MVTKRTPAAKKSARKKVATKKSAKSRTIKVVGEAGDHIARETAATATRTKKTRTKSQDKPSDKPLSAIDAAAKVLSETGEPMNAKQLIDAIVAKEYWTSPAGKTPHATLYSAILREIKAKGSDARFTKTERGKFAIKA